MPLSPDDVDDLLAGAGVDSESLTIILVRGGTREEVLSLLRASDEVFEDPHGDEDHADVTGCAATEIDGGVVALELTGYADPSPRVLAALSALGDAAAVARSNIQAHDRFGCASYGDLVFDADEYMYVEEDEKEFVPTALRPLFDSAWCDLSDDEDDDGEIGGIEVSLAMASHHTGLELTSEDLRRALDSGFHSIPSLTYRE